MTKQVQIIIATRDPNQAYIINDEAPNRRVGLYGKPIPATCFEATDRGVHMRMADGTEIFYPWPSVKYVESKEWKKP